MPTRRASEGLYRSRGPFEPDRARPCDGAEESARRGGASGDRERMMGSIGTLACASEGLYVSPVPFRALASALCGAGTGAGASRGRQDDLRRPIRGGAREGRELISG